MPSARISSYTIYVGRLGELGADRLIVLHHRLLSESDDAEPRNSEIYFADRFGASEFGYTTLGGDDSVRAHLPASDFELWRDLLRHEDPVFVHWTVAEQPGTPEADGIVHLATGPEPTGEGPVDMSPHAS